MTSLGLAADLALRPRGRAAAAVQIAGITSLEVLGSGALPDGSGGASPNGWVARIVLPDVAGATFDPTRISLTVRDPGFDSTGAATTVDRTITGTAVVRQQQPNQTGRLNNASGGVRTVHVALSDDIYAGSTIVGASAAAGFYGAAQAGTIGGLTNSSALAYPKPLFGWLNLPLERATGAGFAVEGVAFHRHARGGQQVACVRYRGRDAQATLNVTAWQTAGQPALSDFVTKGQKPEAWKATIPLASLTQGDVCEVEARVYPWIGDASAVLDLGGTDHVAWPTARAHTRLRFLCDKSGGYGGAFAYVRAGASGGAVSATAATARAAPFPTLVAATTALRTWNGSNRGHSTVSGATIRLMDDGAGGVVAHTLASNADLSGNGTEGKCLCVVEADPLNTGAVSVSLGGIVYPANGTCWKVSITTGTGRFDGFTYAGFVQCFDGASLDVAGATGNINHRIGITHYRNLSVTGYDGGNGSPFYSSGAAVRTLAAAIVGCELTAPSGDGAAFAGLMVGNAFERTRVFEYPAGYSAIETIDAPIIANTLFRNFRGTSGMRLGYERALTGLAIVQNVFESTVQTARELLGLGGDSAAQPIANAIMQHNSFPARDTGGRFNHLYTDVAAAAGVQKQLSARFNIFGQYNIKTDTFTSVTAVSGRTGNWRRRYTVGDLGNLAAGDTNGLTAPDPSGGNWLGERWPADSDPNAAIVTYTDNRSGSGGAGLGTYTLTGVTNPAYGRVPAGRGVLRFDLAGQPRRTDGTGAAGAYERGN